MHRVITVFLPLIVKAQLIKKKTIVRVWPSPVQAPAHQPVSTSHALSHNQCHWMTWTVAQRL